MDLPYSWEFPQFSVYKYCRQPCCQNSRSFAHQCDPKSINLNAIDIEFINLVIQFVPEI